MLPIHDDDRQAIHQARDLAAHELTFAAQAWKGARAGREKVKATTRLLEAHSVLNAMESALSHAKIANENWALRTTLEKGNVENEIRERRKGWWEMIAAAKTSPDPGPQLLRAIALLLADLVPAANPPEPNWSAVNSEWHRQIKENDELMAHMLAR